MNEATDKDIVEYYQGRDELLIKTAKNNYDKGYEAAQEEIIKILEADILLFEQVSKCLDCEGCKKIINKRIEEIKQRIKEE